jgi:hypothetical protein
MRSSKSASVLAGNRYRIINQQQSKPRTQSIIAPQNAKLKFILANSATIGNNVVKARSKSVDTRSGTNGQAKSVQNPTILHTVNSFGLDTLHTNVNQRRRTARIYYQENPEETIKSQELRHLEAKNQLERDRLSKIMHKLEIDLLDAKKELQEEEEEGKFDEEKYKRQISSSSSLSTSGAVVSASSYTSTSPSIIQKNTPTDVMNIRSRKALLRENYYDGNKDYKDSSPERRKQFYKKPHRRHSIGVLNPSQTNKLESTNIDDSRHLGQFVTDNPELITFSKKSANEMVLLRPAKLASKSVSNLPDDSNTKNSDCESNSTNYHQAICSNRILKRDICFRKMDNIKVNEEVKRTIENLSPLSISASSVSSSASSPSMPRMSKAVSGTLVTQIADEVGSIGRAFNRISSSNRRRQTKS